ncbi:MAG TPA: XRE family transcriptional regulator [Clostridia bacterium]|nr:XRE family transcriptional regulator [Clostridia bacterium]
MSNTVEIAERLKGLREMMEISPEEMASVCGMGVKSYLEHEEGKVDFSVTMLFNCAERFGVDVTSLFTGVAPKLGSFSIVKAGDGLSVERRHSFTYQHLASHFKEREAEPFLVIAPYNDEEQNNVIHLSSHKGQEMDYILSGKLRISIDGKEEILSEGDTAYYDSGLPHGMIAVGGTPCKFIAVVLKKG